MASARSRDREAAYIVGRITPVTPAFATWTRCRLRTPGCPRGSAGDAPSPGNVPPGVVLTCAERDGAPGRDQVRRTGRYAYGDAAAGEHVVPGPARDCAGNARPSPGIPVPCV